MNAVNTYPPRTDIESCIAFSFLFSAAKPSFSLSLTANKMISFIASSSAPLRNASRKFAAGVPYKQVLNSPVAESRILLQVPQKVLLNEGIMPNVPL